MKIRLGLFIAGSLVFWLLAVYPAHYVWGGVAVLYTSVALALCLVPATATMAWAGWAFRQSPERYTAMVFGGTGIRMAFVLGAGMLLYLAVPHLFKHTGFLISLLIFYLFTLGFEMALLVLGQPAGQEQSNPQ